MPNIYDGIKAMTDDEIRMQIAFFRNITFSNAAKETGKRFVGAIAGIANTLTEAFANKTPFDYQITKVSDLVNSEYVLLKGKDRSQLEYELNEEIKKKCSDLAGSFFSEGISKERISFLVVSEAAKMYNIEKYMTPANKIEKISIEYNNAFLQVLHNELRKQTPEQVQQCDAAIQKRLNEIPLEAKRELNKRLMPKDFSGQGIGRILRLERTCKYLSDAVEILGVDCFDEVDINIRVVYNSIKSLKRISRVLCARFIWAVRKARKDSYSIEKRILPGYIPMSERAEYLNEEKAFRALLNERVESQKKLEECEKEIEKLNKDVEEIKTSLELENREYDEAQMKFMSLESKKNAYVSGNMPQNDTKNYYSAVNEAKRQLDRAKAEYDKYRQKLDMQVSKLSKLKEEAQTALLNFETSKAKSEQQVEDMADQLRISWKAYYYKFTFSNDVFENVIVEFDSEQRLNIEEMLKEMHDSDDPDAFYIKKTETLKEEVEHTEEEKCVTYCNVSDKTDAVIEYAANYIFSIRRG